MKQFSEQEHEALLKAFKKRKAELMRRKGVHYVDVGYKFEQGKPTDKLAIRVHVYEKKPEAELKAVEILPRDLEKIPIDVIQSKPESGLTQFHFYTLNRINL